MLTKLNSLRKLLRMPKKRKTEAKRRKERVQLNPKNPNLYIPLPSKDA